MNSQTEERLIALNKQFYQTFGGAFSSTRSRLQPGVRKLLEGLAGDEAILDLGCGNGLLAGELIRRNHRGRYVGLDSSPVLLEIARVAGEDPPVMFISADLAAGDWEKEVVAVHDMPFDLVTAFATLHHIPGRLLRLAILKKVHELLRPAGRFFHSEWQFMNSEKLSRRILPWENVGMSPDDLEPGDTLLDWRSGGRGLRYVHHFSEAELEALAAASCFRVDVTFLSDGTDGRLGLYQVWEPYFSSG